MFFPYFSLFCFFNYKQEYRHLYTSSTGAVYYLAVLSCRNLRTPNEGACHSCPLCIVVESGKQFCKFPPIFFGIGRLC